MSGLLEKKGVRTFGDLVRRPEAELRYRYKLQVIVSDLTEQRLLVLPKDAHKLGIEDPDELSVALAIRMSTSIPGFFEPVSFTNRKTGREHLIVDGGMLSNFPLWLFDAEEPLWPTIGVKFIEEDPRAALGTLGSHGGVFKHGLGVGTTEFDLSRERAMNLHELGRAGAEEFLRHKWAGPRGFPHRSSNAVVVQGCFSFREDLLSAVR